MQQGRYVADVLHQRVSGTAEPGPFRYRDLGTMATISAADAIAAVFGLKLRGRLGQLAWACGHIAFLVGWGNRLSSGSWSAGHSCWAAGPAANA